MICKLDGLLWLVPGIFYVCWSEMVPIHGAYISLIKRKVKKSTTANSAVVRQFFLV